MTPSQLFHGMVPAFRTKADVKVPDSVQKLCHCQPCETLFETLAVLKLKYNLEVLMLQNGCSESHNNIFFENRKATHASGNV